MPLARLLFRRLRLPPRADSLFGFAIGSCLMAIMGTDPELLSRYLAAHDEAAFGALVQRHLNLVYSVALRQVGGDAHLAQDVAQRVFADLASLSTSRTCAPNAIRTPISRVR